VGAVAAPEDHPGAAIIWIATRHHGVKTDSPFWAELQRPDGTRLRIEARSHRSVVSQIRFVATVENMRLLKRGPIPLGAKACARCRDLFTQDNDDQPTVCEACLEEIGAGEEFP
jgi:hypothetical protein